MARVTPTELVNINTHDGAMRCSEIGIRRFTFYTSSSKICIWQIHPESFTIQLRSRTQCLYWRDGWNYMYRTWIIKAHSTRAVVMLYKLREHRGAIWRHFVDTHNYEPWNKGSRFEARGVCFKNQSTFALEPWRTYIGWKQVLTTKTFSGYPRNAGPY